MGQVGADLFTTQNMQDMAKGALPGLQNAAGGMQQRANQPQMGGGAPIPITPTPQVSPSYFQQTPAGIPKGPRPNGLFFGGVS